MERAPRQSSTHSVEAGASVRTKPEALEVPNEPKWLRNFLLLIAGAYAALLIQFPNPFFTDDSFFYLQVGRNFSLGYGSTFNRLMPTNGYHPIWMLMCAAVYRLFPGRGAGLHAIAALIVLLNLAVLAGTKRLLTRLGAPEWLAWAVLIPFLFGLQLGTESSLSAAVLTAMLLLLERYLERPTMAAGLAFHSAAILAVLSRLDSIFVVACVWTAGLVWSARQTDGKVLRRYVGMIPLYAGVWGGYLLSNWIWFYTWMPISGLLKSSNAGDHRLGQNLPHTAMIALLMAAISLWVLWRKQRDQWLLYVELPFFAGVLMHAAYITLHMTSETRWTWYYVSWALLAALTTARAGECVLGSPSRKALRVAAMIAVMMIATALWLRLGWERDFKMEASGLGAVALERTVEGQDHIQRLLAFDQPGAMAYYSDISVVPADGLMGDLGYQQELAQHGIGEFLQREKVEAFAGPSIPFGDDGKRIYCDAIFLESTQFTCEPLGNGLWTVTGVEVYSRLPFAPAGYIALPAAQILWTMPGYVTVWRIAGDGKGN